MIRVNLLPVQKRARVTNVEKELILFVLTLVLLAIVLSLTQGWVASKVNGLESEKRKNLAIKNELSQRLEKYHEMEAALDRVSSRLEAIKAIRKDQGLPVRYVDTLVSRMPEEKMWFESLLMKSNGEINLSGVALDNQVFAAYVEELRISPYIRSVSIGQTSRRTVQNLDLVAFQFRIKAGPQPEGGQQ
ncbi:MAG: PilN domain-containing protein [Desulfovibrionales bacterium]